MMKICGYCHRQFDEKQKKCPICGRKLKKHYTEEELREIQKENDDMTVINTLLL